MVYQPPARQGGLALTGPSTGAVDDPIVAIATAPGRGGIGIVRISGAALSAFIFALLSRELPPRRTILTAFRDAQGERFDEGLALFFPAPGSYTGEDVLELHGHGGPVVLGLLLQRCLAVGAPWRLRLAEPGEFTRRAYLNGRIDLAQAEAVADLIDAGSEAAARAAMRSLSGAFSETLNALVRRLTELRALVEATLDFPEEEIEFIERYQVRSRLHTLADDHAAVLRAASQGAVLRNGLYVVLAGAPNVGKSSLLNALAGDEVAIVTAVPGTTRDRNLQSLVLDGVPIHVVDTAGLRDTDDPVERLGIARTHAELAKADLVVNVTAVDANSEKNIPSANDDFNGSLIDAEVPRLNVLNKIDLLTDVGAYLQKTGSALAAVIGVSALTGQGMEQLRSELLRCAGRSPGEESVFLARERHLLALRQAATHIEQARNCLEQTAMPLDVLAEELRLAQLALGAITGEVSPDDLLGEIFSRFCIGK